jgi:DNA modification methylase
MSKQITLSEKIGEIAPSKRNNNHSTFKDPAFAENKTIPIHRWVPWIAGFSCGFVKSALQKYFRKKGYVLDPFSGVGTTLVEALLNGHNSIVFEINPYAAFTSEVKANAYTIDIHELEENICEFGHFFSHAIFSNYRPDSSQPRGFKTRGMFYSPKVLKKVLILQDYIENISHDPIKDLFRLAFASTMVSYSNYSYEPSLGRRKSSGKKDIEDFPVDRVILGKLDEMLKDIKWIKTQLYKKEIPDTKIINESFLKYKYHIDSEIIDLVITSPPYLNNYHYNRNTRPQLYWLGFVKSPKELKPLEQANFGKYWQTVREEKLVDLKFSLPNTDLEERLQLIRSKNPGKGVYGGNGWANYAASYFNDCYTFVEGIMYCLKSGGTALVVIGNSILQGIQVPTDYYFGKIAETVGLELVKIHIPRQARVGTSIINSTVRVGKSPNKQGLYEAVIELRKS